jgi:hypothetical protein
MCGSVNPRPCTTNHRRRFGTAHPEYSMTDSTPPDPTLHVLGALALELTPGSAVARDALPQAEAGALAALVARDLAGFSADAALLQLVTVGAHYDPVELLRPGWPLHRELDQLAARAPLTTHGAGHVIAFGTHDGQLPGTLTASADFTGGPLRLLPFVLGGDASMVARVGDAFERDLLERGMAGADTALAAQDAFGLTIEHARYLTVHDLVAMTAMQYEHVGLAPLWPLIEAALLAPDSEEWLDAPPEPLLHYCDREVRIALLSPSAWHARYAADVPADDARLDRRFEQFQARQRQFAAVLGAHGIAVTFAHCSGGDAANL